MLPRRSNQSLIGPENSLFFRRNSLFRFLGNLLKKAGKIIGPWGYRPEKHPENCEFPVLFPVSQGIAMLRRVR
jgi:hypothetical protein